MIVDINRLKEILDNGTKEELLSFAERNNLVIENGVLKYTKTVDAVETVGYWDRRQGSTKILLNGLYGATLNEYCRFFDRRIAQSTTLSGRVITRHMISHVNLCLTGEYDHHGAAGIYSDTDSAMFSAWPIIKAEVESGKMTWNRDVAVQIYDEIAAQVNASFPELCANAFHAPEQNGKIIRCGREFVGERGLYIKKKRYAVLIYDAEGTRVDLLPKSEADKKGIIFGEGKLKVTGLDLRRSDTPKVVQKFLKDILIDLLTGKGSQDIVDKINNFKENEFCKLPPWEKGSPKKVNNLTKFGDMLKNNGKANMPGHVRAALNWNLLREINNDKFAMEIVDGMKIVVCKLRPNPMNFTSICYPTDELRLPEWFKSLPFDESLMETTIVDKKIDNLLGILKWDLEHRTSSQREILEELFVFD